MRKKEVSSLDTYIAPKIRPIYLNVVTQSSCIKDQRSYDIAGISSDNKLIMYTSEPTSEIVLVMINRLTIYLPNQLTYSPRNHV